MAKEIKGFFVPGQGVVTSDASGGTGTTSPLAGMDFASGARALAPKPSNAKAATPKKPANNKKPSNNKKPNNNKPSNNSKPQTNKPSQGSSAGPPGPTPASLLSVQSKYDNTQISEVKVGGVTITEGTGFYIIGSETGEDRPDQNVRSPDSDGKTLFAPGNWPGAPFSLKITGNNPFHVSIKIGPMPTKYATLSVPFDLKKNLFDTFSFGGSGYEVGAGNSWQKRPGNGGKFKDVPQPAHIEGHGNVGVAKTKVTGPGFWAEVSGATARVRRTILGGDAKEICFYHHPYTHNIEYGFGSVPKGGYVSHEERIEILAANETPGQTQSPKPEPKPTPGGGNGAQPGAPQQGSGAKRLEPLYQGLLGRKPDPAGVGTFGPEAAQGLSGMLAVANQILASAEFAGRRAALNDKQLLEQFYQGLLGRKPDPAGQATFTPWFAQGKTKDVAHSIISSGEFRGKHGI